MKARRKQRRPRTREALAFEDLGLKLGRVCFAETTRLRALLAGWFVAEKERGLGRTFTPKELEAEYAAATRRLARGTRADPRRALVSACLLPRARGIRKAVAPGARFGIFVVLEVLEVPHPHYGFRARVRCSFCGHEQESFLARLRYDAPIYHRGCTRHPHERRWSAMAGRKNVEAVQRLAPETQAAIVALVKARGIAPAAAIFRTSTSTIDRILGSGLVRKDTATRLDARARELAANQDRETA